MYNWGNLCTYIALIIWQKIWCLYYGIFEDIVLGCFIIFFCDCSRVEKDGIFLLDCLVYLVGEMFSQCRLDCFIRITVAGIVDFCCVFN